MNNPTIYYADINDHDETGSDEPVFCHVVLASEYNQLRTELAALKAGQGEAVAYAYEYGKDNGDGSFSVTITRGQIPSYLTPVKDWPIKPLYTAPPAFADAVSVPVELLERILGRLNTAATAFKATRAERDALRALLAQSESKG